MPQTPSQRGVDVVLCTCNGARFLDAQLRSLAAQATRLDRLIVSDDGSSDATLRIVESYAGRLAVDVERRATAIGAIANFQSALARARNAWVFLCDQDDVWHERKVARVLEAAAANPQALLFHSDARIVDADGHPTGRTLSAEVRWPPVARDDTGTGDFGSLLRRNFVTGATVAVRRELIDVALPVPDGFWHDEWLALMAAALGRIVRIAEPLIDYRVHGDNQAGLRGVQASTRLRAMTSARGGYHAERARKLAVLRDRLAALGDRVPPDRLRLADAAHAHWERRSALPAARASRLRIVGDELASGRYRKFSSGWRSAIRDLFEPLGGPRGPGTR